MTRFLPVLGAVAGLAGAIPLVAAPSIQPGNRLFAQRCAMCHQSNGAGLPGQFPRLSGRVATLAQAKPGRRYLALVLLNGMVGPIKADGQSITGLMRSMGALPDQYLAAILNHVTSLGPPANGKKPAPFTAADIAAVRAEKGMSASAVAGERAKLAAAGLVP